MSLLAAPLRQVALRRVNAVPRRFSSTHSEYEHIPFSYKNKTSFAIKTVGYLSLGFSIPFIAAWYQLAKSGGGKSE